MSNLGAPHDQILRQRSRQVPQVERPQYLKEYLDVTTDQLYIYIYILEIAFEKFVSYSTRESAAWSTEQSDLEK